MTPKPQDVHVKYCRCISLAHEYIAHTVHIGHAWYNAMYSVTVLGTPVHARVMALTHRFYPTHPNF